MIRPRGLPATEHDAALAPLPALSGVFSAFAPKNVRQITLEVFAKFEFEEVGHLALFLRPHRGILAEATISRTQHGRLSAGMRSIHSSRPGSVVLA